MTGYICPRRSLLSLTVVCTVLGFTTVVAEAFVVPSSSTPRNALLSTTPSLSTRDKVGVLQSFVTYASTTTTLCSSVSKVASSSLKKSKTNNKASKKMKQKSGGSTLPQPTRIPGPGHSLTQDELSDHVSKRYMGTLTILDDDDNGAQELNGREMRANLEEQEAFLRELGARPALVLNADFQPLSYLPLSLWSWQDAIKAIFGGKVQVVDVYPDICVRAANLEVPLPSVIALSEYVPHKNQRPAFTRRNVFLRDEYKCQYCNGRFHTADLSLDHVHPRSKGGQLVWENAVTSCLRCNGRKGSMPVAELRSIGMRLIREPRCPTQMELAAKAARMVPRRVHTTWKPFLGIAETPASVTAATSNKNKKSTIGNKRTGDEESIDDRYFVNDDETYYSDY